MIAEQKNTETINETYCEVAEKNIGNKTMRDVILAIEQGMKDMPDAWIGSKGNRDCADCPLTHTFSDGIYLRELFIPAGKYIGGEIHIHNHPVFLMEGEIIVITEQGYKHLLAPEYFISPAGTKRVAFTLSDTKWVTCHPNPTDEKDLDKLEDLNIATSFEEYDKILQYKEIPLLT